MKKTNLWLIAILVVVLSARLFFSVSHPHFMPEAYDYLVHTKEIASSLIPDPLKIVSSDLYTDNLAYNYIIALCSHFTGIEIASTIIPNAFAALVSLVCFIIVRDLTKDDTASLLSALVSGFIPVFFTETFDSLSIYTIVIPVFFLLSYSFMNITQKKHEHRYLIFLLALIVLHPAISIFILSIIFYFIILQTEKVKLKKQETEIIIFTMLLYVWFTFLIYKNKMLLLGPNIIWQNIPQSVLGQYYYGVDFFSIIAGVGLIPFMAGIYMIYKYIFRERNHKMNFILAIGLSVMVLIIFNLIKLKVGLIFLGIIFALLLGLFYNYINEYISKTKVAKYGPLIRISIILITIISILIVTISNSITTLSESQVTDMVEVLKQSEINRTDLVISSPDTSNMITYFKDSRLILSDQYLKYDNPDKLYNDIEELYTTPFIIDALRIIRDYNITYIMLSEWERERFGVPILKYSKASCIDFSKYKDIILYSTKNCLENSIRDEYRDRLALSEIFNETDLVLRRSLPD
ncbi:glycosyltransferase family 39 protein [Candidatus Woesearchaeota archaeon]|nr:glycosyltransferase family 39 protein [Candidatus Woesearchaeota archaeon]